MDAYARAMRSRKTHIEDHEEELPQGIGGILLRRVDCAGSSFWDRAHRNCITGQVQLLEAEGLPDFSLTDLWARRSVCKSVSELMADKYLFRTVPLVYRTWIYHELNRKRRAGTELGSEDLLRQVLSWQCVDVPVSAGRWSPLVLYAPSSLLACLTSDMVTVLVALVAVVWLSLYSIVLNEVESFAQLRLSSLPVRLLLLAGLVLRWRVVPPSASLDTLQLVGFLGPLVLLVLDLIFGDGCQLASKRFCCSYEVFRELPEKVYVCRRHGAAHLEESLGDRGIVDQCVSGTGYWERNYTLIADVHGLLVELRPVKPQEWEQVAYHFYSFQRSPTFIGVDACSHRSGRGRHFLGNGPS